MLISTAMIFSTSARSNDFFLTSVVVGHHQPI
jgi:hypothetical protein